MEPEDATDDAGLIARYRAGDEAAAGALFHRHHEPARRFAVSLAGSVRGDDVASEAFQRVLAALRRGNGPDLAFRPYLMTTVRSVHVDLVRREGRQVLVDDPATLPSAAVDESALRGESSLLAQAFRSLPERWQTVLWHTTIEQDGNDVVARLLGIRPGAVAALAYRAREGLREAYLAAHLAGTDEPACRAVQEQLPAHARGRLSLPAAAAVEAHLDECRRCAGVLVDLRHVTSDLGALLAPALLGTSVAASYATAPDGGVSRTSGGGVAAPVAGGVGLGVLGTAAAAVAAVAVVAATALSGPGDVTADRAAARPDAEPGASAREAPSGPATDEDEGTGSPEETAVATTSGEANDPPVTPAGLVRPAPAVPPVTGSPPVTVPPIDPPPTTGHELVLLQHIEPITHAPGEHYLALAALTPVPAVLTLTVRGLREVRVLPSFDGSSTTCTAAVADVVTCSVVPNAAGYANVVLDVSTDPAEDLDLRAELTAEGNVDPTPENAVVTSPAPTAPQETVAPEPEPAPEVAAEPQLEPALQPVEEPAQP